MSSSVLSVVQYFILFSFIFVQLKNIFWSESTGLFFQGSESGPPRLYCLIYIFKGHTCQLQRTFCLWLVGIQSRLDVTSSEGKLVENAECWPWFTGLASMERVSRFSVLQRDTGFS